MKVIKGNYGECRFQDCLQGLNDVQKDEYELCWSDIPWGHRYDGTKPMGINKKAVKNDVIKYDDLFDPSFHQEWYYHINNLTKGQVLCVGRKHKGWWIKEYFEKYLWEIQVVYPNGQGSTEVSQHGGHMPYLCFSDSGYFKQHKFWKDYYETYIPNGFLRKEQYIHPSPKEFGLWCKMMKDLKPSSVIDPFLGSGTTGEVCEFLGIPWLGFEIKEEYAPDIKKRIQRGIKKHSQQSLKLFMEVA